MVNSFLKECLFILQYTLFITILFYDPIDRYMIHCDLTLSMLRLEILMLTLLFLLGIVTALGRCLPSMKQKQWWHPCIVHHFKLSVDEDHHVEIDPKIIECAVNDIYLKLEPLIR